MIPAAAEHQAPDQLPTAAIRSAKLASDASADARPDATEDALPAPLAVQSVERSAVPGQADPALDAVALPVAESVPCRPDAGQFAA